MSTILNMKMVKLTKLNIKKGSEQNWVVLIRYAVYCSENKERYGDLLLDVSSMRLLNPYFLRILGYAFAYQKTVKNHLAEA